MRGADDQLMGKVNTGTTDEVHPGGGEVRGQPGSSN